MSKFTKTKSLTLASLLIAVAIIGINANPTHADSSSANASVTVANTISLTLTGGDLVIENLTPGNSADSNSITATVTSNSPFGFHLAATTGTSTGTDSLVNTADSNFTFANLSTNKASLSNFNDNTWGYSYSTDSGTTWVSGDYGQATAGYNGLPLDNNDSGATSTTLFNTDNYLGSKAVQFKIGVKSATTQAAGTYTNIINFYAVTNPAPFCMTHTCMQDLTSASIATLLPTVNSTATVYDGRDEQAYTIAKLADNKYWMIENLNLAGGTALSPDDTDVTSEYIANTTFPTENRLIKDGSTLVLPASATKNTDDNNLTEGSQFGTDNYSYVFNSGNKTNCGASSQDAPCYSYYSWDAATLGSGRNISTNNVDAEQSICPKGWKLPTAYTTDKTNWQTASDSYVLAHQYGLDSTTSTDESDNEFYTQAGSGTTPNFLLAGYYNYGSFSNGGWYGHYWSSTSSNASNARHLNFNSSSVNSASSYRRRYGQSVRCLFSGQ